VLREIHHEILTVHATRITLSRIKDYNSPMSAYRFYHPIEVRYGDLDPQGHVNNARYLTYMEQARVAYIRRLGLWDGGSFLSIGIILADAHLTFRQPVLFGQAVRVGVRVTHLGNKSLKMEYALEDAQNGQELASGSTVLVAFDYHAGRTILIPGTWRRAIAAFDELEGS
jgi:acyl-CoA thioester hydrolase